MTTLVLFGLAAAALAAYLAWAYGGEVLAALVEAAGDVFDAVLGGGE